LFLFMLFSLFLWMKLIKKIGYSILQISRMLTQKKDQP
jgi:hypothetical protein